MEKQSFKYLYASKNSMVESKWRKQKKAHEPTTEGVCPYCKKHVKALEAHMKIKHLKELKKKAKK